MLAELIVVFIALVIIGISLYYLIRLSNVKTPPKDVKSSKEPASVGATGTSSTPADVPPGVVRTAISSAGRPPCVRPSFEDYTAAIAAGGQRAIDTKAAVDNCNAQGQ
jgi:hypothetical protein